MLKRSNLISCALVVVLLLTSISFALAQDAAPVVSPTLDRINERGELICGANANLPGFGVVNEAGEYAGFDVDICRAVAAAILGDANAVTFRPLNASERQAAIQNGEVDMIARNTTWTLSRDTTWGTTFAPTVFYDGQGFMVPTELGLTTIEELDGASICVQSGTTTELNLADAMSGRGLEYTSQVFPDAPSTWEGYLAGRCDAFTTDRSGLISYKATAEDPGAHTILDITISKEPLAPLTPQADPAFSDIVSWTVYGLIQAEEFGITSENIDEFLESENPDIQRFLGVGDNASGSYLGIDNQFMVNVIRQVGNYGEIFDRNLGPDTVFGLERGINALWTNGGLLYSPPFR
ncbi:MAG: amino acid ABC transporter substrate-binding protein [Burkholderiales bacterium]|nr:amino acid ABC transporter substrate-binding protein [Anaerolineae bacterium]